MPMSRITEESYRSTSKDSSHVSSYESSQESPPDSKRVSPAKRSLSASSKHYKGYRPQKAHHTSNPDTIDESTIQQGCVEFLKNVQTPFKGFGNKLKRICSDLSSTCNPKRLEDVRSAIAHVYRPHKLPMYLQTKDTFRYLCNFLIDSDKSYVNAIWQGSMTSYYLQFRGQEGVGEGVTRTAFQMMLDEIRDTKFFVPAEPGSSRYVVNPAITADHMYSLGYFVSDEEDVQFVYKQIGAFMALCTRYDIPIPFSLSRGILANLIYRHSEIEDDEYVMYYLLEMPQMASSLVSILQHPSSIQDALPDAEFNDYYPLVNNKNNKAITTESFKEYMRLLAKHQLIQQHAVGAHNTHETLRAFLSGFYIRRHLRKMSVTVSELDRLMHGIGITEQALKDWLTPDRITTDLDTPEHQEIMKWLKQIILSGGTGFPLDIVDTQPRSSKSMSKHKKTEFLNFIGKLMYFWTGVRKLDTSRQYQVIFIDTVLPMASTCFYQLKLPHSVQSKDELYRKLVTAAYNVEQGVGLYGGKKKVR